MEEAIEKIRLNLCEQFPRLELVQNHLKLQDGGFDALAEIVSGVSSELERIELKLLKLV